jgi:hypothetical protein
MKKIKYISLLAGLAFVFFLFSGCKKDKVAGGGAVISDQRDVRDFYNVHIYGKTPVTITGGTTFKVEVKGYENLIPHLKTTVENGTLKIQFDNNVDVTNDNSEVHITMPSLVSLNSEGTGEVGVTGPFVNMDIFSVEKTGLGDITLNQTNAESFKLLINGNSNFKGFGLSCKNAIVTLIGNGIAELTVSDNLNATIRGNGIVYYKGNPAVKTTIDGNGQVLKK